jgi:xanthine dehydrogenase accessory factor
MKQLKAICTAYEDNQRRGVRSALATTVHTSGYTDHRAGERMLIAEDGQIEGSICNGCFEADLVERAMSVLDSGTPEIARYNTRSDVDLVWRLGVGCQGAVEILIESLAEKESARQYVDFLAGCERAREPNIIATIIGAVAGTPDVHIGDRLMLAPDGVKSIQVTNPALALQMLGDAFDALDDRQSGVKSYGASNATIKAFIEVIEPPVPLLIFGGGPDALPVVHSAKELGWRVTVVDTCARAASPVGFEEADEVVRCRPEEIEEYLEIDMRTAAIFLAHNSPNDLQLLEKLILSPSRSHGQLAPRNSSEKFPGEIAATDDITTGLYRSTGSEAGGDTP